MMVGSSAMVLEMAVEDLREAGEVREDSEDRWECGWVRGGRIRRGGRGEIVNPNRRKTYRLNPPR